MGKKPLKLTPALVPESLHGRSVFYALKRGPKWEIIREATKKAAGNKCEICGATSDRYMYCHEEWNYDIFNKIATIVRFKWICRDCNGVIHIAGGPFSHSGGLENDPRARFLIT